MYITNGDQYNIEIKQLANEKYIESCLYMIKTVKKEKFALTDNHLQRRNDVARVALKAETVQQGANILKNDFPGEYIVHGDKMRGNVEYELREAKKQKLIDYKPMYDPITFKIPDEHREQIQEWIDNDFRKRINGEITRSRCLSMIGPTQHGPPTLLPDTTNFNTFDINENDPIELQCPVTNSPDLSIQWSKNNEDLDPMWSSSNLVIKRFLLKIRQAHLTDAADGAISTNVDNTEPQNVMPWEADSLHGEAPEFVSRSDDDQTGPTKVIQPEETLQFFGDDPQNISVDLDKTAMLNCRVQTNDPTTKIQWLKKINIQQLFRPDAIVFGSEQYENVGQFQEQQLQQNSKNILSRPLIISQVTNKDNGQYICLIQNEKATKYKKVFIDVIDNHYGVTSSANLNNHLLYVIIVALCVLGVILFFLFCCRHRRLKTNNHYHSHHSHFTDGIKSSIKPRQPLVHQKGPMVPATTTRTSNDYIANSVDSIPITRQSQRQRYVNTLSSDLASVTSSNLYYARVQAF
ncbi:unnamed protein product [Adineta steineri]|uniref:Ig-like domain-containing protein n=1 Tax=Adineta steineri TaxID=433720 RepID=A0A815QWQ3_9BILA|nr:unnamed protein product [Adineta steineri]CAF3984199.1 unnamed protein product [Adineta steineri]